MTAAVSCVQSAISLEAQTPAFFFSAWSKHVLTASHSILKHRQLGADGDIKKTHPKHLHQPAVKKFIVISPESFLFFSPKKTFLFPAAAAASFLAAEQKCSRLYILHMDETVIIRRTNVPLSRSVQRTAMLFCLSLWHLSLRAARFHMYKDTVFFKKEAAFKNPYTHTNKNTHRDTQSNTKTRTASSHSPVQPVVLIILQQKRGQGGGKCHAVDGGLLF